MPAGKNNYGMLIYRMPLFGFQMELTDKEAEHQKLYLEMYRKGQESARFEREEEVRYQSYIALFCLLFFSLHTDIMYVNGFHLHFHHKAKGKKCIVSGNRTDPSVLPPTQSFFTRPHSCTPVTLACMVRNER